MYAVDGTLGLVCNLCEHHWCKACKVLPLVSLPDSTMSAGSWPCVPALLYTVLITLACW